MNEIRSIEDKARDYILHGLYFNLYGFFKYLPSPIGDLIRGLLTRPFMKKMGKVRMYEGVTVWYPYRIEIGDNVTLNEWVYINGLGGLKIGNGVRIAHRATILSTYHIVEDTERFMHTQGQVGAMTVIEDDVLIGCNSTILMGVTIGRGAIIGAGAVVTKDVDSYAVVAGVPARKIRDRRAEIIIE